MWPISSRLSHVTVLPAPTSSVSGLNWNTCTVTSVDVAFARPPIASAISENPAAITRAQNLMSASPPTLGYGRVAQADLDDDWKGGRDYGDRR